MTEVKKTYKHYVNGKFVRSESGKVYSIDLKNEKYEIPLTSKKDLRDAVTSSKAGFTKWNSLSSNILIVSIIELSGASKPFKNSELIITPGPG